ncbi:MAG: serine/threonine-protein phosphatase [Gammaproteobacteria bacterium]|nr:serine/threonine-protein phosphatase [Gammaproteobacteria bacterium]
MQFEFGRTSRLGNRVINQDRIEIIEGNDSVVLVLGDGLGGKPGGELAAQTLVDTISNELDLNPLPAEEPEAFLRELLRRAHQNILINGRAQTPPVEPGTTAVICLVQNGKAWWAHAGDSRLYLFRDGLPLYRTTDHSYVEQLYQEGRISLKKINKHPMRNYVTQCIGLSNNVPEITVSNGVEVKERDIILLCSDGFWEPLGDAQMGPALEHPLDDALNALAESAESASYPKSDNATSVALRVTSLQLLKATPPKQQRQKQAAGHAYPADNLDDAIDEIQRAIRDYEYEMKTDK